MDLKKLPLNNITQNTGRSALLIVLVALLSCALFGGTVVVSSLQNGLASLEARMGADVIVVPQSARSTADLEAIMLDGVPGYFYMDDSFVDAVAGLEGVEKVSPQYYLATVKAGCCTMPVQIIGIDPATDFTIQPWIARSYSQELGQCDVVAGCNITGAPGAQIMFYGVTCTIVAKLDETGTALDNAVFCTASTVKELIAASEDRGMSVLSDNDPEHVVSTIQVKVRDGYSTKDLVDYINVHVRGIYAVEARAMTSGIADSMSGVSAVIGALAAVIWIFAIVVLIITFIMAARHRRREFAILRVIGASRAQLSRIIVTESLIVSVVGAVIGIAVFALVAIMNDGVLEQALGLPFLIPSVPQLILMGAISFVVAVVAAAVVSGICARNLSKVDPGQTLRGE